MDQQDCEAALRPLDRIRPALEALRQGGQPLEDRSWAVIQAAAAVEASLRRLLRDLPRASIEVRLRALATDELRADEVLAELRQHDRISIGLAAAVHDLWEVRRRLTSGGAAEGEDAALAARVAEALEREVLRQAPEPAVLPEPEPLPADGTLPQRAPATRRARWPAWTAAGLAVLALVGLGLWWAVPRERGHMAQGIALFRSGSYADAAHHFHRHAQANPDEATPHLYLARIHRRMRRPDLAGPALKAALELAPEDPDVLTELGFLQLDTGQPDQAVAQFRAALGHDPEASAAWIGLVRALRSTGRADVAARVLERAPAEVRAMLAERAAATDSL